MTQKPKAVLIVDDDEGMRDTLTAILKREYRVLRVASGEAALPILNREDIDLMLLDVRLPGISGFEVLRNASERQDLNRQVLTLSAQVADQTEREFVVGPSKTTRDIIDLVNKIAKLSATVL